MVITSFKLIPFANKLISLNVLSSGGMTYLPTTNSSKVFNVNYFYNTRSEIRYVFKNPSMFRIFNLPSFSKISLIELIPGNGIQYIRSSGTVGKMVKKD